MSKRILFLTLLVIFSLTPLLIPINSEAAPNFARQTGFSCNTCHFQHYPALNAFGREFKANGYTMVGSQGLIEADLLSLPVTLNASLITKIRYQKSNGDNELADKKNNGELQFPDEGALLIGGRVGEHIGFLLEAQLVDGEASNWASFKLPFVYDVKDTKLLIVPFTTDAAGPAQGFELLNTGALRFQRVLEHRKDISAQQYLNTARDAQGVSFALYRDIGYVSYTPWSPEHGSSDASPYLHYVRAVLTPTIASWDTAIGVQLWSGETEFSEDTTTETACLGAGNPIAACTAAGEIVSSTTAGTAESAAEAWVVDAQAQGALGGKPVGIYFTYGVATRSEATISNLFNSSTTDDRSAFTALVEVGVIPQKLALSVGFRGASNGNAVDDQENSLTIGAVYQVTQNVSLQLNNTSYDYDIEQSIGDNLLTLMLFAAF
ncbi:MAG: hypothetical protein KAR06_11400 [Deltaproteobacteria bacterium]|nr:hypothetical protein [Deltaproteobacteria bacterium]